MRRKPILTVLRGVLTDKQFLLLVAFVFIISVSIGYTIRAGDNRMKEEVQLRQFVAKLRHHNADYADVHTVLDKRTLRLFGHVRNDDEVAVLSRYVKTTFGLDDWNAGQMIRVEVVRQPSTTSSTAG